MYRSISAQDLDGSSIFWHAEWQHDDGPPGATIFTGKSGSTPRSLRRDLAGTGLALAHDATPGPFESSHRDDGRTTYGTRDGGAPAMARATTTGSHGGYNSAPPSTHSISSCHNGNSKRDFYHVDMDYSLSYTYGSAPASWQTTATATISHPRVDEVHVYEPADYCLKLSSDRKPEGMQSASKKARVDCFDANQQSSQQPYAQSMCMPLVHHHVSPSTSMSTHLSPPSSLASSEEMSRQSSVTSASVTDALDMMRVQSSFSTDSDNIFPVDDLDDSFIPYATEEPAGSSQPAIGFDGSSVAQLFDNVDYGLVGTEFPFVDHSLSDATTVGGQQHAHGHSLSLAQGEGMVRSASLSSTSSNSSSDVKASERRRKHIENGRQSIAPKSIPDGPTLAASKSTTDVDKFIKLEDSSVKRKEAIAKAPYVRPQHPKLYCTMCEEFPGGFRGEHELRRHCDRAHADYRKVWICTEPTTRTEWWPAKPLGICKQCKQQKQYNVYYNAAAHLRRAHFCPRKRGRKARGDKRESRAGKAGGDWPPIDWLKANGWLQEIEVTSEQAFGQAQKGMEMKASSSDVTTTGIHDMDNFATQQDGLVCGSGISSHHEVLAAEALGLQTFTVMTNFNFGYPTPIDSSALSMQWPAAAGHVASMMEQKASAPSTFTPVTPMFTPGGYSQMF